MPVNRQAIFGSSRGSRQGPEVLRIPGPEFVHRTFAGMGRLKGMLPRRVAHAILARMPEANDPVAWRRAGLNFPRGPAGQRPLPFPRRPNPRGLAGQFRVASLSRVQAGVPVSGESSPDEIERGVAILQFRPGIGPGQQTGTHIPGAGRPEEVRAVPVRAARLRARARCYRDDPGPHVVFPQPLPLFPVRTV